MPIPLSDRTEKIAQALFRGSECSRILERLINEVSENIPFQENSTPEEMERIRFSILKLIAEDPEYENSAFDLAKVDWRDLFMNAGFGYSATEHESWYKKTIINNG